MVPENAAESAGFVPVWLMGVITVALLDKPKVSRSPCAQSAFGMARVTFERAWLAVPG